MMEIGVFSRGRRESWRRRGVYWSLALALHVAPLALFIIAFPPHAPASSNPFGQGVSVTLVTGSQSSGSPPAVADRRPDDFSAIQQRLGQSDTQPSSDSASSGDTSKLSELMAETEGSGQPNTSGSTAGRDFGASDDPFSRASVSYTGAPSKAAKLQAKVRQCARGSGAMRVLIIINERGDLAAAPKVIGLASGAVGAKAITAISRCAPYPSAALPGLPRSYEIDLD